MRIYGKLHKKDALKLTIPINIIQKKREFSNTEKKIVFVNGVIFIIVINCTSVVSMEKKVIAQSIAFASKEGEKLYQYVGLT